MKSKQLTTEEMVKVNYTKKNRIEKKFNCVKKQSKVDISVNTQDTDHCTY